MTFGPGGTVIATWEEQASGTRRVALARGTPGNAGTIRFARQVISDTTSAMQPVVATTADGVIAAWTSGAARQSVLRTAQFPR